MLLTARNYLGEQSNPRCCSLHACCVFLWRELSLMNNGEDEEKSCWRIRDLKLTTLLFAHTKPFGF